MRSSFTILSPSEQLAAHLKEQVRRGRWKGRFPGQSRLVAEFGVGTETVRNALAQLEREGLLVSQGKGKSREINLAAADGKEGLHVRMLPYGGEFDPGLPYVMDILRLGEDAGHHVTIERKSLGELGMDVARVRRFVEKRSADAWIVSAANGEVLRWFAEQPTPAFALFGNVTGVDIASVNVRPFGVLERILECLIEKGHQRIVWLVRRERREPKPSAMQQRFLDMLAASGIQVNKAYNLPDWEETAAGLEHCLKGLFRYTPPTAILASTPQIFLPVQYFIGRRGYEVPRDLSLVCMDVVEGEPMLDLFSPQPTHYLTDWGKVARHAVQWLNQVARGREHRRQVILGAQYVEGETLGPVRRGGP